MSAAVRQSVVLRMHDSQPPSVIELNMTSNIGVSEGKHI